MPEGTFVRRLSHPAFAAAFARVLTLPVSLICGLLATHTTIASLGPRVFGVASLILTLQMLFAFLDLGTGAAVLNEAARFRVHGDRSTLLNTWNSSRRVAERACLGLLLLIIGLSAGHILPRLLGVDDVAGVSVAVTAVVLINVVSRPAMLALAVLQGLGHSVAVVMLQALVPLVSLGVVLLGAAAHAPLAVFASSLVAGQLVSGLMALAMVSRRYALPVFSFSSRIRNGARVSLRSQAGPMLIINLVAPLAVGLDRISLAHLSTPLALASYALVAQLLQPVYSLAATLNQSLWGDFSRKRHEGSLTWASVRPPLMVVGVGALTCAIGFAAMAPWVAHLLANGTISVEHGLGALAGVVGMLNLMCVVPGSLLTSPAGLAAQARILVGVVALNLCVTWALTPTWGAAGPLAGSAVGLAVQCAILARLVRQDLQSLRREGLTR